MKISKVLLKIFIFFILYISFFLVYVNLRGKYDQYVFISNFILLLFISFFMVFGDKYNYSLNKLFYLYNYFFLGIAPILQYSYNINFWTNKNILEKEYFKLNTILIFTLIFYQILYHIFSKIRYNKLENYFLKKFSLENKKIRMLLLVTLPLLVLCLTVYRLNFNFKLLFFKTTLINDNLYEYSQINNLIYSNFIVIIPFLCLIIFKVLKIKNKAIEIYLVTIFLLINFPTSLSRYAIARVYIPLILFYIKSLRKYFVLNFIIIFGLLYLFPFFNQFRYFESFEAIKFNFDFSMFLEGHFDSYQNFLRVISENIITNGKQLLGVVLFFIPRSIWKEKSIGSGALLAEKANFYFSNIAMNYFGEGYINFGYFGIILFIIFIAYINSRFDKLYWHCKKNNYFIIFYLLLLSMEIFILRGDLMSSFAYLVGAFSSSLFVYCAVLYRRRK